ncbi:stearoyl-CoA desaturase 5 [Centrocercus urophasianus]|uniref:stearoyl-CoA desaturase 5 n=1 Tax=Centrocercus urophasianus TaxID=9002 RepID=UPI001C65321A|nr:stearoyl-CoA desaturase 5 [Centrocercus urophasianus]
MRPAQRQPWEPRDGSEGLAPLLHGTSGSAQGPSFAGHQVRSRRSSCRPATPPHPPFRSAALRAGPARCHGRRHGRRGPLAPVGPRQRGGGRHRCRAAAAIGCRYAGPAGSRPLPSSPTAASGGEMAAGGGQAIVWRNVVLMGLLHLGAVYALSLVPRAQLLTLLWAYFCFLMTALGVTAGAHRLWSHRSYKAKLPLRIFLAAANSMAFQNDIYEWSRDHRVHHKYSETDADPHNARRGFFFSHIGWLFVRKHKDVIEKGRKLDFTDLLDDPVVRFQRKYYKSSVVLMCFVIPTVVPWYLWGESLWNAYFLASILRYTISLNVTWLVNSAAHMYGNRPYDKYINPRQNTFVTLGAIGEGFHNYHHTFPFDYSASELGLKFNPTTWFIDFMFWLGLVTDRKQAPKEMIQARKERTGDGSA